MTSPARTLSIPRSTMSAAPEELLKTAEKRASSSGGWFSSGSAKLEEAVELFKAAGNKFRLASRFDEAGQAFMRAAETEIKAGETDYAANTFFEASKSFKMARPERAWAVTGEMWSKGWGGRSHSEHFLSWPS